MKDDSVSIAKSFAIILMVLAHTFFWDFGDSWINMFHMPLFFFFAGYCFKEKYLQDTMGFIKRRFFFFECCFRCFIYFRITEEKGKDQPDISGQGRWSGQPAGHHDFQRQINGAVKPHHSGRQINHPQIAIDRRYDRPVRTR